MATDIVHYYRKTAPSHSFVSSVQEELRLGGLNEEAEKILGVETESCFNVQVDTALTSEQTTRLEWLLAETFEPHALLLEKSTFRDDGSFWTCEFGPRMTFTSAFSSNAVSICQACGLPISRLELSRRYRFEVSSELSEQGLKVLKANLHDRMTEEEYATTLLSFDNGATTADVRTIPVMERGRAALEELNNEMGLGFDDFDLDYYTNLFKVRTIWFPSTWVLPLLIRAFVDLPGEIGA
jgi:phosphoribosylformylglycinamidine synthase